MDFDNIRIKTVNCVFDFTPSSYKWNVKNRETHIIGVQTNGSAIHDFGYKKFTITGDCIFFLNQKDDYSVNVIEAGRSYSIHFTTYEPVATDSFCIKIKDSTPIINLIKKIDYLKSVSSAEDSLLMSNMYKLCSDFNHIRSKKYSSSDRRILKASQYIDEHFKESDCLDSAAKAAGVSRRRFNDLFKMTFGTTPNRYLISRKIDLAKNLLKTGYLSVSDTAELCGFGDIYYFSKVFKAETGILPGEYRKR